MRKYNLIFLMLVVSCTTEKKAQKYFDKHEDKAAKYCDAKFPNTVLNDPEIKTGTVKHDTVWIPEILTGTVPCPPEKVNTQIKYEVQTKSKIINHHQTDTLIKEVENTKRVKALQADKAQLQCVVDDLNKSMSRARKLIYWLTGALAVAVSWIFRKQIRKAIIPV